MNEPREPWISATRAPCDGVSVVVPTYNEAPCLQELVARTAKALGVLGVPVEVLIVDDGSPDGTAGLARKLAGGIPFPLRVLERSGPRSLALSVVEGAKMACYSCVAVLDADLSHDPGDLPRVVRPVLSGCTDLCVGSRYTPGGAITAWPLHRRIVSSAGATLARALTRARDPLSGFFACRREVLDGSTIALRPRGYKILFEVLGRARGLRVRDVPICFKDRTAGESKFGAREALEFLLQFCVLFVLRLLRRPKFRKADSETLLSTRTLSIKPLSEIHP